SWDLARIEQNAAYQVSKRLRESQAMAREGVDAIVETHDYINERTRDRHPALEAEVRSIEVVLAHCTTLLIARYTGRELRDCPIMLLRLLRAVSAVIWAVAVTDDLMKAKQELADLKANDRRLVAELLRQAKQEVDTLIHRQDNCTTCQGAGWVRRLRTTA